MTLSFENDKDKHIKSTLITFYEYMEGSKFTTKGKSEKTKISYISVVRNFMVFLKKKRIKLDDITTETVNEFSKYKDCEENNKFARRGLKDSSVNAYTAALTLFFKSIGKPKILEGRVYESVLDSKAHTLTKKQVESSVVEAGKLRKHNILNFRNEILIEFLFQTGFRVAEVASARLYNFDMRTRIITIPSKGKKLQRAKLSEEWVGKFKKYLDERKDIEDGEKRALFINFFGTPLSTMSIWSIVTDANSLAEITNPETEKPFTPHDFRAANITERARLGESFRNIQHTSGHADPKTTERYMRMAGVDEEMKKRINPMEKGET